MSKKLVTVTDLAALIHAREEIRAELRSLAVHAYEQWCELEARLELLEERMDRSCCELTEPSVRVSSCPPPISNVRSG